MPNSVKRNVSLQPYNSMAVAATAAYLTEVTSPQQVRRALEYADQQKLRTLVLGAGSNTLFTKDFDGLVILSRIKGIELLEKNSETVLVKVASGENWHEFVAYTLQKGWHGLENLALIPGLVGAAPIQNIGAYGVELKDNFVELEYLHVETGELLTLSRDECEFGYRDSIFKKGLAGKAVITSVTLRLARTAKLNLSYPALAKIFTNESLVTPLEVFNQICEIRRRKLPLPAQIPNTGSFFKNPLVGKQQHQSLKEGFPELVSFAVMDQFKLAAAWLIEEAGWKNKTFDGVSVHQQQALVIINKEGASGAEVLRFAQAIQQDIEVKFGVQLEIEPQLV